MFTNLFQSSDVVATTFEAAIVATLAGGTLSLLGLSWVSWRWRWRGLLFLFPASVICRRQGYGWQLTVLPRRIAILYGLRCSQCKLHRSISSRELPVECRSACSGALWLLQC